MKKLVEIIYRKLSGWKKIGDFEIQLENLLGRKYLNLRLYSSEIHISTLDSGGYYIASVGGHFDTVEAAVTEACVQLKELHERKIRQDKACGAIEQFMENVESYSFKV